MNPRIFSKQRSASPPGKTGAEVPTLTKVMLGPEPAVFAACSPYTRNHMQSLSKVLLFTVSVCGLVLAISLSRFGFHNSAWSYLITVPLCSTLYLLLDRLVVMADSKVNASYIKNSRYVVAIVFGLLNSLLLDSLWYSSDIAAERAKEVSVQQTIVQQTADSLKNVQVADKSRLLETISAEQQELKERNAAIVLEAEGRGPSREIGKGKIFAAKVEAYGRDSALVAEQKAIVLAEAVKRDSAIAAIQWDAEKKKAEVPSHISKGITTDMTMLHKVVFSSGMNILVAVLLFVMALILELLPLLGKRYLDIAEYFGHAARHIDTHNANAELKKTQVIHAEQHRMTLAHERELKHESGKHRILSMQGDMAMSEELLNSTETHLDVVIKKEEAMQGRFPRHFAEIIKPLFSDIYERLAVRRQTPSANGQRASPNPQFS